MGFKLKQKPKYPRRLWLLLGYPGDGKSTFAAQMQAPLLPIDADHRFDEVMTLVAGDVYAFGNVPADNVLVARIADELYTNMADEPQVATIVVDSLTAIIKPLVSRAVMDNAAGANKNKAAAFVEKAVAVKLLQDAVSAWGTDVLWIAHLQDGRDQNGRPVVTTTIPPTELARLQRSLNARLRVVRQGEKRGIFVEWSRGRSGVTLWDDTGRWAGMPEKLDAAMYDGLDAGATAAQHFTGPDQAIAWAVKQGAYADAAAAKAAYESVKQEGKPSSAAEMWDLWIAHVASHVPAGSEAAEGGY